MFMGLADGRILYEALKSRYHPIGTVIMFVWKNMTMKRQALKTQSHTGQYRQDVTYPDVYDYLNCLSVGLNFLFLSL